VRYETHMGTPEDDLVNIESLKNMLVSFATGGEGDDAEYRRLRTDLLRDPALRKELPRFIQTCRNVGEFWEYIKAKFAHYQERREFLREEFDPVLTRLETLHWRQANDGDTRDVPHLRAAGAAPEPVNVQDERDERRYEWDAFICHASEDKPFVSQLAIELRKEFRVWYDDFTLKVGDRLRRKIDEGLAKSRYGIVVLSENFFNKHWPQEELDGLAQRETDGRKVILPVWLGVGDEEVRAYSVTLADRIAARGDSGLPEVVRQLSEVLREGKPGGSEPKQGQQSTASRLRQTEQGDDPVWAALASAMEAGKRPVVGAGMMKISVPGVVQELVVDAAMLVEALKDGPLFKKEIDGTSGGVYENLGMAIPDAQRQGLVMEEPSSNGERVMLTAKGRLLVRILEEDRRLSESRPTHVTASEIPPQGPSAKAPSQLTITPAETTVGGKVDIVPLGWIPAGDLESLSCSVQGPSGTRWAKEVHQDLRMGMHPKLVFPDDFDAANTEEQGLYVARADRVSGDGDLIEWGAEGVFRIRLPRRARLRQPGRLA